MYGFVVNSSNDVNMNNIASSVSMGDIQLLFAKLQLELAESNKADAMRRIKNIKAEQEKTAQLVDLINSIRGQIGNVTDDSHDITISDNLSKGADEYGVGLGSGKIKLAAVKASIQSLEAKKDTIGSDIQQEMVLIQDAMGKYSAYINGATSQISKHTDTLTNVARGQ